MRAAQNKELASCYQCAGVNHCYGQKNPSLDRKKARFTAQNCRSLHRGFTTEIISVIGYKRGLSRANAEKLVSNNYARWCGYKTIEPLSDLPVGIHNRLTKVKKQKKEVLLIS